MAGGRVGLGTGVELESDAVRRVTAVARRIPCPTFADLLWPPTPPTLDILTDAGVMLESALRVVVFQRIGGELRYYAGGWCPDQTHIHLEQERVAAEGYELGVFGSVADALAFAGEYLAEGRSFANVEAVRAVRYS